MAGLAHSAKELEHSNGRTEKERNLLEEQATQCARALRNLSVNCKFNIAGYFR